MSIHRFGAQRSLLAQGSRAVWICLLAGLFLVALSAGAGGRATLAQTDQAQTDDSTTAVAPPEPATAVPSPPSANSKPKQAAKPEAPKPEAEQPESATAVRPEAAPLAPLDDNQKAVADASANLLELANSLKKEVDKTTADTLSVAVVRKATEIEQLARKMRTR